MAPRRSSPAQVQHVIVEEPVNEEGYDYVNHPPHYTPESIECIDALQVILTPEEFVGFLRGTVIKYQWRLRRKPEEDLVQEVQKCNWYARKLEEELMAQAQAANDEAQ